MQTNSLDNQNDKEQPIPNLDLAYEYTKIVLDAKDKSISNINTRLGTFLGFGGLLLRFAIELPDKCLTCLVLKITVLLFSCISVCLSATGLLSNGIGAAVKPKKLMSDEWFHESNPRVKAFITNTWTNVVEEMEESAIQKSKKLNLAIQLLALAVVTFTINASIASIFKECL